MKCLDWPTQQELAEKLIRITQMQRSFEMRYQGRPSLFQSSFLKVVMVLSFS